MSKITEYAASTATKEVQYFVVAIDSNEDGTYETKKQALNILRASLYATSSLMLKLSKGADVASANALVLGVDGNHFDITGTTAITSITTVQIGVVVMLQFSASLVLTHHTTDLQLPGAVNIQTAAGDIAAFTETSTGKWKCLFYTRNAAPPTGVTTPVYIDAAPQALSGAGAVDIVSPVTNISTTGGTDALTFVDSTVLGQLKTINHSVDGGGYVLTPTTLSGGTTITVTDPSVSITLMWTASGWRLVGQVGVATIA